MGNAAIGVIGLGVMGESLALNIESRNLSVAVYNRSADKTEAFRANRGAGKQFEWATTLEEFVSALSSPRKILLMVKAGRAVDAVLEQLRPLLEPGDIVVDGGNSFLEDTQRRISELDGTDIRYLGMGVSGGEEGALHGPSLMPGGDRTAYDALEPILTAIAATTEAGPCVTYVGSGSAGHFVKMVHNGIEYGDMQLIAEAYDLLRQLGGVSSEAMRSVFEEWNDGELQSYLIEITAEVVNFIDHQTQQPLVDLIVDRAGQKGTGKWTTQVAMNLGVPIPTITAAVDARFLSSFKEERVAASQTLRGPSMDDGSSNDRQLIQDVRQALYASKICAYAQGFALLRAASQAYGYDLVYEEIARIWKGGCIIRAAMLDGIREALHADSQLMNLMTAERFQTELAERQDAWRRVVALAAAQGIGAPAMAASLAYYDGYRRERLPAYLIQGQRDYFGAHTYERVDQPGVFHTEWQSAETLL